MLSIIILIILITITKRNHFNKESSSKRQINLINQNLFTNKEPNLRKQEEIKLDTKNKRKRINLEIRANLINNNNPHS